MKKTIISALAAISLVASAQAVNELNITQAGDTWAGNYSFSFMLTSDQLSSLTNGTVLAAYWGSVRDVNGANVTTYYSNALTAVVSEGGVTLKLGRGELSGLTKDTASSYVLASDTTMNFQDSVSFTTTITADVVYTLSVTGANQAMLPTLSWDGGAETLAAYKGNMNGGVGNGNPLYSDFNSNVATFVAPAVPEPATATLSLLALAGLAARRRRA
ncbi:MAG: PEP-CTERM sorting domain-containing protein [Akkermansia sp.]